MKILVCFLTILVNLLIVSLVRLGKSPFCLSLEDVRKLIMVRINRKRDWMLNYNRPICPKPLAKLEKGKIKSKYKKVTSNKEYKYEVAYGKCNLL